MFKLSRQFCEMIETLDHETILCGPGRDPEETEIDDIFGKDVQDCIPDILADCGLSEEVELLAELRARIAAGEILASHKTSRGEKIAIVACQDREGWDLGPVALHQKEEGGLEIVGSFVGVDITVDYDFRRQGIGLLLAACRLMQDEYLPTWHLDEPAYSSAGAECMQNALDLLQEAIQSLRTGAEMPKLLSGARISAPGLTPTKEEVQPFT